MPDPTVREVLAPLQGQVDPALLDRVVGLYGSAYRQGGLDSLRHVLTALSAEEEAGVPTTRERVIVAVRAAQDAAFDGPLPEVWA